MSDKKSEIIKSIQETGRYPESSTVSTTRIVTESAKEKSPSEKRTTRMVLDYKTVVSEDEKKDK